MRRLYDHMDNTFRKAYDQFETEPSANVWNNIRGHLDAMPQKKYRSGAITKGFIMLMIIGSAMVLYDVLNQTGNNKFLPPGNNIKSTFPSQPAMIAPVEKPIENLHHYLNPNTKNNSKISTDPSKYNIRENVDQLFNIHVNGYEIKHPKVFTTGTGNEMKQKFPLFTQRQIPATSDIPVSYNGFVPYWTVAGIVSNGYAAYKLDIDLPSNYQQMKQISQREKNELSYSAGVYVTYHFHKRFGIQTGLIYSNTQIQIDPQKIYAFDDPDGDVGFQYVTSSGYTFIRPKFSNSPTVGDSLNATEAKHSFKTVSLPLVLKYNNISEGKFSFHPGAGIIANYIISAGLETEVTDAFNRESVIVNKLKGTRNFYWSAYADVEFQYRLRPELSINFRPAVNYAISPITDNNIVETFPYSITAGIGLTYKF